MSVEVLNFMSFHHIEINRKNLPAKLNKGKGLQSRLPSDISTISRSLGGLIKMSSSNAPGYSRVIIKEKKQYAIDFSVQLRKLNYILYIFLNKKSNLPGSLLLTSSLIKFITITLQILMAVKLTIFS